MSNNRVFVQQKNWISPFHHFEIGTEWQEENNGYFKPSCEPKVLITEMDILSNSDWFIEKKEQPKEEDGFIWDDKSVSDFCNYMAKPRVPWANSIMEEKMGKFKQLKSGNKDYHHVRFDYDQKYAHGHEYTVESENPIPKEKFDAIKKAIEQVLNQ